MDDTGSSGRLRPGSRLGPYDIVQFIDAGGMGEVYHGRDTKLDRDVALKLLLPAVAEHPERLARFEREARLLAALSHPRIASIHGIEDSGASPALVMEFVGGITLAQRLAVGSLSIDETVQIARQIAEGLEYAHERGVVHRDLKPANVKVGADDSVKILDFGLAKALDADGGEQPSPAHSPTVTWMATEQGVILGTAAYMAPEQARGKAADRRADIWAFGCVVYEMLTGSPAFGGNTATDILAAVVREEPDWTRLPPTTPDDLVRLVRRCLRKDVRQRLQAIGDARIALEEIASGAPSAPTPTSTTPRRWRDVLLAAVAGGALVAVVAAALAGRRPPAPAAHRPVTRFIITLPPGQALAQLDRPALALSDDGRALAFVADDTAGGGSRIYVRPMDGYEARPLPGTERAANPFFSPDGQWLGFFADGKLAKVPVSGGAPHPVADVVNSIGGTWTDRHTIVFVPLASGVQEVPDGGGTPSTLSGMQPGETSLGFPGRLPGDAGVMFTALTARDQVFALQPPGGGARKDLMRGALGLMAQYSPSGHLVFSQGGSLMAVPFDLATLSVLGTSPAVPVVNDLWQVSPQFSVASNGTLAYVAGPAPSMLNRLVWVTRDGIVQPLNAPTGYYYQPRVSPDGRRVACDLPKGDGLQVWLYDLERDTLAPATFGGNNRHPIWTRDSRYLIYQSDRDGTQRIYRQAADGTGTPEPLMGETLLASEGVFNIPYSVAGDGVLTFVKLFPTKNAQFWTLHVPSGPTEDARRADDARSFLEADSADGAPQLSPDGRWLAYASVQAGKGRQIYVRAFPGPGGPWQVSDDGGDEPQWNPNGRELFFRSGRRMIAVAVDTRAGFRAGKPHVLFEGDFETVRGGYARANYDVSPDGTRFLMVRRETAGQPRPRQIQVVLNWSEELTRLVPLRR